MTRALLLTALTLCLGLGWATTSASAATQDQLTVSVSATTGPTGVPITVTFSGNDTPYDKNGDTPKLYALVRPANGVACQSTFGQDQQVAGSDSPAVFYNDNSGPNVNSGNFSYAQSYTPSGGSYIVCAWLETDNNDYSGRGDVASQVVVGTATSAFAATNTDTLGVALSSASPAIGLPMTLTFAGTDTPYDGNGDTPKLYALIRNNNGVGCQPTFGADQQVAGSDNPQVLYNDDSGPNVSDGNFSYPLSFTPTQGSYIVCAWLETDGNDYGGRNDVASQVVVGSTSATFATPIPTYTGTQSTPLPAPTKPKRGQLPQVRVRLSLGWTWTANNSTLDTIATKGSKPKGLAVEFRCSGKGCPSLSGVNAKHLSLTKRFKAVEGKVFGPGAKLEIVLTAPRHRAERIRATVRSGKIPLLALVS